jgi:hypothetical protein
MPATLDQQRPAWLAALSALVVVSAFVAGKAARDAILLSHYSIESLPLFVAVSAALSLPIIIVAGKWMARYGPGRLVPVLNAASGACAIAEWALIGSYPRTVAVVVFFHLSSASAVLVSGFWSIVNERFDIHSAKRHIGRIGLGATLGGILGGVIAERTAVYFARDAILLVIAGMQLICAAMLHGFGRGAAPVTLHAAEPGTWTALGTVVRSSLLRTVGVLVVLAAVGAGAIDYVFKADLVASTTHEALLRELALFYTATSVITAVVQVAVCGPLIARLGVPRSVATLPFAITGFGVLALAVRMPLTATLARGAELVSRNSAFRAAYEVLYAPLPADQKRPAKVVLDVGADKVGDILAAQLVGAIVYTIADARNALLIATVATGALGVLVALRLPSSYTKALEQSLITAAADHPDLDDNGTPEPWITLSRMPSFGHGDVVSIRLGARRRAMGTAPPPSATDRIVQVTRDLRSRDLARVKRTLASPLPVEVALVAVELVDDRDDLAREVMASLRAAAPRCTGLLVDVLLDQSRPVRLRRRLPAIVARGQPDLAAWGLWRSLMDRSFEVRSQSSAMLSPLAADGHLASVSPEDVFACVRRELFVSDEEWRGRRLVRDEVWDPEPDELSAEISLEHVFRVLGLVLPAEPLRIALRAVQTDDAAFRGMALEYLESVLPPDVHAQLWPILDHEHASRVLDTTAARSQGHTAEALLAQLNESYQAIVDKLRQRRHG